MYGEIEAFFGNPTLQAITVAAVLLFLYVIAPFSQHRARSKLTAHQKSLFDPTAKDILFQVSVLFSTVLLYSLLAVVRKDMSFVAGDVLPFVCFSGATVAGWNLRRSVLSIRAARKGSDQARTERLNDVYARGLRVYLPGLLAFTYGLITIPFVVLMPKLIPGWLWFGSLMITGASTRALGWSIAVFNVASEYERNPKLGRSSNRFKR